MRQVALAAAILSALTVLPPRSRCATSESADLASVAARWPEAYAASQKQLRAAPPLSDSSRRGVVSALLAASRFLRAENAPADAREGLTAAAKGEFRVAVAALGDTQERFLGRGGGLGDIAREVLGDAEFISILDSIPGVGAQSPGVLSARAQALFDAGRYAEAEAAAREAIRADPSDQAAVTVLRFSEGRVAPTSEGGKAARPTISPSAVAPSAADSPRGAVSLPEAELPLEFRRAAVAPPSLSKTPRLDPKAPDYWDKQLLSPLLAHSDKNVVAREYLSPLLRDRKVTIRVESIRANPELKGDWGYYDLETSVIHYNLDSINADIRRFDAYYARRDPSRRLAPISPTRPLDPAQVDYIAGRFLPLAVHEAGGHGTHAGDLTRRLGALSGPMNKDTEIMAWRLEAAAIAAERQKDKTYLTEDTPWAREENDWMTTWRRSRSASDPKIVTGFLNSMPEYSYLVQIGRDPESVRKRYAGSVALVQANCRSQYGAACGTAIDRLSELFPEKGRLKLLEARKYLDAHPDDGGARAAVMSALMKRAVEIDRLDPRGITVVSRYYAEQERKVAHLEALADPLTIWQKVEALWSK